MMAWAAVQTPYLHFLAQLRRAFSSRPMVLLECRHVSVTLFAQAVGDDKVVAALVEVMRRHGWSRGAFVGHSCAPLLVSQHAAGMQACNTHEHGIGLQDEHELGSEPEPEAEH